MPAVVIAGYGVEGRASYAYWRSLGYDVAIADEKTTIGDVPDDTQLIVGPTALAQLGGFDLIIRAPSIAPAKLP